MDSKLNYFSFCVKYNFILDTKLMCPISQIDSHCQYWEIEVVMNGGKFVSQTVSLL